MNRSLLIVGPGAEKRADEVVRTLLNISEVDNNPDLFVVDATNGAGVDESEEIVKRSALLPVFAPYTVIYIKRMDKVTVQGQNKLLKTIEEVPHVVFIMTAEGDVLDTIRSRVRVISLAPLSYEEFKKVSDNPSLPLYYVKNGVMEKEVDEDLLAIYQSVYEAVKDRNVKLLFDTLHITGEKDKDNFFAVYKPNVKQLYSLITATAVESGFDECGEVADVIGSHLKWCESVSYTKDNFFECMASLAMIM